MFSKFTTFFRGYDWFLVVVIFVLCAISLSAIYSVDLSQGKDLVYFPKQLLNIIMGFVLVFILGRVHRTRYMGLARFVYIFGFLLLILVLSIVASARVLMQWVQAQPRQKKCLSKHQKKDGQTYSNTCGSIKKFRM